eukprot:521272-Lingulodinium_polyedra.AAC.1
MCVYDKLNQWNLATAEHPSRRALMIQRAVKRNPRAPDFDGLGVYLARRFDSAGGLITKDFD